MEDLSIGEETNPQVVAQRLTEEFGPRLDELGETVEALLRELDRPAETTHAYAHRYFEEWRALTDSMVRVALRSHLAKLPPIEERWDRFFERLAPSAPRSLWVVSFGIRAGLGLHLLSEIRAVMALPPLDPPKVSWDLRLWEGIREQLAEASVVLLVEFASHSKTEEAGIIERIMTQFGLDRTGFGRLFGVNSETVSEWLAQRVPDDKKAKLATVAAIGDLLSRQLKQGLLPGVSRKPAAAYGDQTILELIENDRHDWLLEDVRASFEWAATA